MNFDDIKSKFEYHAVKRGLIPEFKVYRIHMSFEGRKFLQQ
jgi:hypothetical protein